VSVTAIIPVDLADCAQEPIRIPGSIQPHGVLLVLDPASMCVVQLAGDTDAILGVAADTLLGGALQKQVALAAALRLEALKLREHLAAKPPFVFATRFNDRALTVSAHLGAGKLMLEIEPVRDAPPDGVELVQGMMSRLQDFTTTGQLLDRIASEVRAASGFDRVMVYRFLDDASGLVEAESRATGYDEPFLGLHYPAGDIPEQARALYLNSWIRCIPDIRYTPMPLRPASDTPLDLSFCALRSVSTLHLEYLANMGVRASMSLSLIVNGRLWGLVACHAAAPTYLDSRLRGALELFAQLASLQLRTHLELEQAQQRVQVRNTLGHLMQAMSSGDLQDCLVARDPSLLDFIAGTGVTVRIDGHNHNAGVTPPQHQIDAIADWLDGAMQDGVLATDALAASVPSCAAHLDTAAGVLALSITRSPRDYILWYLPEYVTTVTWAGEPGKIVSGTGRLSPRTSFAAWTRTVAGMSRPWTALERESAAILRVAITDIVLARTDAMARQNAKARQQQELLMSELDHRVKNTLATIQAVVRFSSKTAEDLKSFTETLQRRLHSMAKTHSLLTDHGWTGAPIRSLVEDELAAYADCARVTLTGDNVVLDNRAALSLALAVHELATNSAKHGSLSVAEGRLDVRWSQAAGAKAPVLRLEWTERGGPAVTPPTRRGFGRTLLERVFAGDVDGSAALDFQPAGLVCVLEISASHVAQSEPVLAAPAALDPRRNSRATGRLNLKILIVEDGGLTGLDLADFLAETGAEIVGPFRNMGASAAAALEAEYDVALLDIDINGKPIWPIATLIRGRAKPIVFLTAYGKSAVRPDGFGEYPTLTKPFQTKALLEALEPFSNPVAP
jgi:chemotaxis family two-component system sensor kinase Cph1